MKHINKILLCAHPHIMNLDTVDHAADIARTGDAEIKVFHVISGYPADISEWWNVRNPQKLHSNIQNDRESFLVAIVGRLKERGVQKVSSELVWGKPFLEITREVIRHGHDLVMLTARDRSQMAKRVLECPSRDLFLNCPCSLWIARQGKVIQHTRKVVAALGGDGGKIDLAPDGLNAKILKNAAAVAEANQSELHIIHVLPKYGRKGIKKGQKVRPDLVEFVDNLKAQCTKDCGSIMTDYGLSLGPNQFHLLVGDPSNVIPEFATELNADLIVMGTVARKGIQGLVYGNTAENVLQEVDCPILAVKPDDFISVVTLDKSTTAEQKEALS